MQPSLQVRCPLSRDRWQGHRKAMRCKLVLPRMGRQVLLQMLKISQALENAPTRAHRAKWHLLRRPRKGPCE